jgi:hypothetical protein
MSQSLLKMVNRGNNSKSGTMGRYLKKATTNFFKYTFLETFDLKTHRALSSTKSSISHKFHNHITLINKPSFNRNPLIKAQSNLLILQTVSRSVDSLIGIK